MVSLLQLDMGVPVRLVELVEPVGLVELAVAVVDADIGKG